MWPMSFMVELVHSWRKSHVKYLVQLGFSQQASPEIVKSLQVPSAKAVWGLYLNSTIREMYVRGDQRGAVLIAESPNLETIRTAISSIPLVQSGQLGGEIVQLNPFSDLSLAFAA